MSRDSVAPVPADRFALGVFALLGRGGVPGEPDGGFDFESASRQVIAELFGDDPPLGNAFLARFLALVDVLDMRELSPWRSADPGVSGQIRLHPALVTAAARIRLNANGKFPRNKLVRLVEDISTSRYADWSWQDDGD